jgi:hypothetical protein
MPLAWTQLESGGSLVNSVRERPWTGTRPVGLIVGAVISLSLVALLAAYAIRWGPFRQEPVASQPGLSVTIGVEPFETSDSIPASWQSAAFAESLAIRLSLVPGLRAEATGASGARYTLRGRVAMQDGRLVLATRLGRDAERDTVWTATFWRNPASASSILPDLASAVAEAVFGETVRQAQKEVKR